MQTTPIYDFAQKVPHALQELQEAVGHRHLIFQLVRRDILTRYKRSFLGVAWTMLNPLGIMLIISFVFSNIFGSIHCLSRLYSKWSDGLEFLCPEYHGRDEQPGLGGRFAATHLHSRGLLLVFLPLDRVWLTCS